MTRYGMALDLRRCAGCGACVVACQMQHGQKPGVSWNEIDVAEWGTEEGAPGRSYVPHACMQCDEPPCVSVCPTGASYRRDDGITLVDYEKCIACGFCMSACPYHARVLNDSTENMMGALVAAPYETYGVQRSFVVEKCTFCEDRIAEGRQPACVWNCPGKARYFGDLDDAESPVAKFVSDDDVARIDQTSFFYRPVSDMPREALPFAAGSSQVRSGTKKADPGVDPVVLGAGVAAVAGLGAGAAVLYKRSKTGEEK